MVGFCFGTRFFSFLFSFDEVLVCIGLLVFFFLFFFIDESASVNFFSCSALRTVSDNLELMCKFLRSSLNCSLSSMYFFSI